MGDDSGQKKFASLLKKEKWDWQMTDLDKTCFM